MFALLTQGLETVTIANKGLLYYCIVLFTLYSASFRSLDLLPRSSWGLIFEPSWCSQEIALRNNN